MTTEETELYNEAGDTPSQAALDSQQAGKAFLERTRAQGGLDLAKSQIADAVRDGADAARGRELLGQIDEYEQYPDSATPEATVKLYSDHKAFIRSPGAAPQAAQAAPPSPAPAPKKVNINKARQDYHEGKTNVFPG